MIPGEETRIPFRAVLFDLDGTLISSASMAKRVLSDLFRKYKQRSVTDDEMQEYKGMPTRQILADIDPDQADALLQECIALEIRYRHLSYLFPGMLETLQTLEARGIRLGVITAEAGPEVDALRAHFSLDGCIDVWVTADDVPLPKPDPESVFHALKALHVTPQETLFVGDSHYDILAGQRAGAKTGVALWGMKDPQRLIDLKPDHLFHHPREILELCAP